MRVLNWALDAQKTMGGKIISVILSVALIFSFSNFFYGNNAFADTEEDTKSELVDQVSDKPAEENSEVVVPAKQTEQKPAAKAATPQVKPQANYASLDELNEAFLAVGEALESGIIQAGIDAIDNYLSVYSKLSDTDKGANAEGVDQAKAYRENLVAALNAEKNDTEYTEPSIMPMANHGYNIYVYMGLEYSSSISDQEKTDFVSYLETQGYKENGSTTHNWFTLGMFSNVSNIPDSTTKNPQNTYSNPIKSLDNITAYNGNKALIDYVTTIPSTIFIAKGANGYIEDNKGKPETYTWHLNTKASVVKYTWVDGYSDDSIIKTTADFSKVTPQAPSDPTRKGYEFTGWKESTNNGDVTYTAQWKPLDIKDYVTLTPADAEKTYDGTALAAGIATATDKNGKTVKVEYSTDGTNWTEDIATITATDVADSKTIQVRASVESAYNGYVTAEQKLTINKRDVTVAGEGWTEDQPYTGSEYAKSGTTFTNVVEGQTATIGYELKGTEVGNYTGAFAEDFKVMNGEADVTANYNLTTKTPGALNIVKSDIKDYVTLTPADAEKTYDGTALAAGIATATDKNGKTVKVEYSTDGTNWTEDIATITATDVADSKTIQVRASVESAYNGYVTAEQKLTIIHAEVTVTAGNATKVYGTSDPSFEATVEGLVPADATNTSLIQYSIAREAGEDVGTYAITAAGDEIQGNYKVTYAPGTLTIVPQSIDPNDPTQPTDPADPTTDPNQPVYNNAQVNNPENVVYNAQSQQQPIEVTDSEGNIIDPSNYTVDYTEAVNAGTVTVTITGQGNYAGSVTRTYQITPAPVTITVNDATKVAGAADPAFTGQVTEGQIYNNELGDITFTRTNGDQATGTYADVLTANYAANSNYAVTVVPGTFTITAAPAPAPAPAPTPAPAPAPAPATPAAAPAAPAAAPAAPAVVIPDEENPLAAPEQEIADDENPLAAFDHEECWVHWFMIAGIILTIIYGAAVVLRRTRNTKHIDKMEKDLIGTTNESTVTVGSAHHSHA